MAEHAGGYVWFDGVYSTNQVHQRTRFKCAPHPIRTKRTARRAGNGTRSTSRCRGENRSAPWPDFDPKRARSQVSDAAGRHAAKQRPSALPPSEQRAVSETKRANMRDHMAKRREREDADRAAKGLPVIKRKGAYGPRKLKPLSVIPPDELADRDDF